MNKQQLIEQRRQQGESLYKQRHPTIDHIIPMARGGGHVWDNVQVAHAICNSIKRDSIEVEAHEAS